MNKMESLKHLPKDFWSLPLFSMVLVVILTVIFYQFETSRQQNLKDEELSLELAQVSSRLQAAILEDLSMIQGLRALIQTKPDLSQEEFSDAAAVMISQSSRYRNIAAARDLIITHMYPLEGNERAIGLNYRTNELQWPAVERAISIKRATVAGPINLIQGGRGFIIRLPVFLSGQDGEETLWGMVSAVQDYDAVLSLVLAGETDSLEIAVRGADGAGASGAVIYGDSTIFADPNAVIQDVQFASGSWQLASRSKVDQGYALLDYWEIWLTALVAVFAVVTNTMLRAQGLLERERAVRNIQQSEKRLRMILDKSSDAIFILDKSNHVVQAANQQAHKLLDYDEGRLLGSPLHLLVDDYEGVARHIRELGEDPEFMADFEGQLVSIHSDNVPVQFFISFVKIDEELILQLIARDISMWKKAEQSLTIAKREAEQANEMKTAILANTSHDLRTPLGGILGIIKLIKKESINDHVLGLVNMAETTSNHMLSLINDIVDVTRLEEGKLEIRQTPFNLSEMLKNKQQLFALTARAKNISVQLVNNIPDDLILLGDDVRLRQILSNLIGNAVKFTNEGYVRISATGLRIDKSYEFQITIEDTGPGIPEDEQKGLFQRFKQTSLSVAHAQDSSGLGLSICKQLISLMRGEIGFDSLEGKGSKFWIRLSLPVSDQPLKKTVQERPNFDSLHETIDLTQVKESLEDSGALTDVKDQPKQEREKKSLDHKLNILVAEDNSLNQMLIMRIIESMGYTSLIANTGYEVIAALDELSGEEDGFDLILMDVRMPEMGGLEATQKIRASNKAYRSIPIIALTADSSDSIVRECREAGMDGYVTKPIELDLLQAEIKKVLEA